MNARISLSVITCVVAIFSSCSAKSKSESEITTKPKSPAETVADGGSIDASSRLALVKRDYFGTIAKTSVKDDDVDIRRFPNPSSESIAKASKGDIVEIRGYSIEQEEIDGYRGYWVKVSVADNEDGYYRDNFGSFGWIFSKFVDVDPEIAVSALRVVKVNPKTDRTAMNLLLEIDRNGEKAEKKVVPSKLQNQAFYTFVWSDDIPGFLYSDPVGTFKWNPDTNELSHLTYMGSDCESAWCLVTDDKKYLLQDYGASPGPRGLGIFDMRTNKQLYSGSYYRDLEYDGKSVTIVKVYNSWSVQYKHIDERSIMHAEEFLKDTPVAGEGLTYNSEGGVGEIFVKYRLDLATRELDYLNCEYSHVQ